MINNRKIQHFQTDHLINFCESITDCHHSSPKYLEDGKLVIRNFNIKGGRMILVNPSFTDEETFNIRISRSIPKEGDLIITREAPMGEVCIIPEGVECCLGQRMVLIKPDYSKVDNKYLLYSLLSQYVQIQINKSEGTGSIVSNLRIPTLKELNIPKRELSDQNAIGKVLSDLDAKIELNNKINAELEAMAKLIYDYWFVQFEFPFDFAQGKPNEEGKPYKSSGGKMVWNEELKREVPEGWEVNELGTELTVQRGISYKSSEINDDGIAMINLNSFNLNGTFKPSGIKKYSGKYSDKNLVSEGDLLIAITDVTRNADIIGKAIIVPNYYSELVISMDIAKISPSKKLSESFLMMLFNSNQYHNYIKWFASGTIVLHLNLDGMNWYKTEIPPKSLLNKFDSILLPITSRIADTNKQNQKLAELRDWLLPMLMNGQVKVV
jgi:type I restriction enzyme S subunit